MKFKPKDTVYVVWSCEFICKQKIFCVEKDYYIFEDQSYGIEEDTFKKLSDAKVYARGLLDDYILKTSKYIDNIRPTLDS